ncbi:MAG: hypothetical protein H6704_25435 [Myxococcales bacterium]|nr:hypothetical protein [Myxococcales bacterium]
MSDRAAAHRLLAALGETSLGDAPILVESSGLFGFDTAVPALTEDVDLALPEALVASHGEAIVAELAARGFDHPAGSATFVDPRDGTTFDFLGHGDPLLGDHIGGSGRLRVMVFRDLSVLLDDRRTVQRLAHGRGLSPAGFVASKLLTERAHKGSKDKIQALLVIAERDRDDAFRSDLAGLLSHFDAERLDDALADAQGAFMALAHDPSFRDAGAEGYASAAQDAARGLELLTQVLDG